MAKVPNYSTGTSVGVRYWLFFMLVFAFMGYSTWLSIGFGAIGGLAGGFIAAWQSPKESDEAAQAKLEEKEQLGEESSINPLAPPKKPQFQQYSVMGSRPRRPTKAVRRYGWFFRRK